MRKTILAGIESEAAKRRRTASAAKEESEVTYITIEYVDALEQEMLAAAESLEFERAASLRDRVLQLRENIGKPMSEIEFEKPAGEATGRQKKRRKGIKGSRGGRVPKPHRG